MSDDSYIPSDNKHMSTNDNHPLPAVYAVGSDGDMHIQPHALVRVLYDNIHRVMGRGGDGGGGGHHDDVGDSMVAGHTQQHTQQHIQQHTQHIQPSMEVLNKQFAALHEVQRCVYVQTTFMVCI